MNRYLSRRVLLESGAVAWALVALLIVWAYSQSDDFRTGANLSNLSRQLAVLGVIAAAQFIVVISEGVDLSLAANARFSAIITAIVMDGDNSRFVLGLVAGLITGLVIGAINAFIVTRLRVEPFIATLGTGALVTGLALYFASTPIGRSSPLLDDFYGFSIRGIYLTFALLIAVWLLIAFLLNKTPWGRHLYGVGGDPDIAALSGVKSQSVKARAYVLAGLLGGLAGILILASAGVGDAASVKGLEFDSLAVVVIGGASLAGGRGRLIGMVGGVLLFSLIGNVFNLVNIDIWYQELVRGIIILIAAAALVDGYTKKRKKRFNVPRNTSREIGAQHGNDS